MSDEIEASRQKVIKTSASLAKERRRQREQQRRLNDPQWRENQILRIIRNSKGEPLRRQDFTNKTGIQSPHVIRTHLEKLQQQNKIRLLQAAGNRGNRYTIVNQ